MTRPKLLDLYCGAGGAAMGYHQAGFDVTGVDNRPQPNYPYEFVQADALTFPLDGFDAYHASPPCQHYSLQTRHDGRDKHPDLIAPTRKRLKATGMPYIIENVTGARRKLQHPLMLCGSSFGLQVWRHRYFEIEPQLVLTPPCQHTERPWTVTGDHGDSREYRRPSGTLRARKPRSLAHAQEVMGINWMNWHEICEAIPPAYTEYIGQQLLEVL